MNLFQKLFTKYFYPAIKSYCTANQLHSKALLILDNAPTLPSYLGELSISVKVFLPPYTTSVLLPMDQGVIAGLGHITLEKHFPKL
jgi:hypothetical protein